MNSGPDAWSMVDVSPSDSNPHVTQPIVINENNVNLTEAKQAPSSSRPGSVDITLATSSSDSIPVPDNVGMKAESAPVEGASGAWMDTVYSSSRMVMKTVECLYTRTSEATGGILPRFDKYVQQLVQSIL